MEMRLRWGQMFFMAAQVLLAFAILPEAPGLQIRGMVILQRCVTQMVMEFQVQ
jgi:hypothetical protein